MKCYCDTVEIYDQNITLSQSTKKIWRLVISKLQSKLFRSYLFPCFSHVEFNMIFKGITTATFVMHALKSVVINSSILSGICKNKAWRKFLISILNDLNVSVFLNRRISPVTNVTILTSNALNIVWMNQLIRKE